MWEKIAFGLLFIPCIVCLLWELVFPPQSQDDEYSPLRHIRPKKDD